MAETRPFRTSPHSRVSRPSGMLHGPSTARTCSTEIRAAEVGRAGIFSVDTPPPTASGSLHIGHVFSYTHTDVKVRFERMRGKTVSDPMGWIQAFPRAPRADVHGVRCDPSLPYVADFTPPYEGGETSRAGRRSGSGQPRNFIELCEKLTVEDEEHFEGAVAFTRLSRGLDADRTAPSPDDTIRTSQLAFLRNLERGEAYQAPCPDALGHRLPLRHRAGGARGSRSARRLRPRRLPQDRRDRRRPHRDHTPRAVAARSRSRGASR